MRSVIYKNPLHGGAITFFYTMKLVSGPLQICYYFFFILVGNLSNGYLKSADNFDVQETNFEKKHF